MSHQRIWLQIVALGMVYPSVLLIYFGEAAYLMHNTQDFAQSYFKVSCCRDAKVCAKVSFAAIRIRELEQVSWWPLLSLHGQQTIRLYTQNRGYKESITSLQRNANCQQILR